MPGLKLAGRIILGLGGLVLLATFLNRAGSDRADIAGIPKTGSSICKSDVLLESFPVCGPACPPGSHKAAYKMTTRAICSNRLAPGCDRIWFFGWSDEFDDSYCRSRGYDGTIRALPSASRSAGAVGGLCFRGLRKACLESVGPATAGIDPATQFQ